MAKTIGALSRFSGASKCHKMYWFEGSPRSEVIHHMVINHNFIPYYVHIDVRDNVCLSDGDNLLTKFNPFLFKKFCVVALPAISKFILY